MFYPQTDKVKSAVIMTSLEMVCKQNLSFL